MTSILEEKNNALDTNKTKLNRKDAEALGDELIERCCVCHLSRQPRYSCFEPLPGNTSLGDTDVIGLYDAETDMKFIIAQLENSPILSQVLFIKSNN